MSGRFLIKVVDGLLVREDDRVRLQLSLNLGDGQVKGRLGAGDEFGVGGHLDPSQMRVMGP